MNKKRFTALVSEFNRILKQIDDVFTTKLLLWMNKCRSITKDVQHEQTDIFDFFEKDVIPLLHRQREIISKMLEELSKDA